MELIDLIIDAEALRTRSVPLLHSSTGLDRGLEFLERVVLRDPETEEFHSGRVTGIAPIEEDTVYTFEVGVRLPKDLAIDRLAGFPSASNYLGVQDVLDLLGEARKGHRSEG